MLPRGVEQTVRRPAHTPQGVPLLSLDHTVGHGHVLYARTRVHPSLARTCCPSVCTRCGHRPSAAPSALQAFCISLLQAHRVCLSPPAAQAPAPSRQAACTGYARRQLQARPFPSQAQVARLRGAVGNPSRGKEACASGVGHQRAPRGTPVLHHLPRGKDCQDHSHRMRELPRASKIPQLSP